MNTPFSGEQLLATVRQTELRRCMAACLQARNDSDRATALRELMSVLNSAPLADWLRSAVDLANGKVIAAAVSLLREALQRWPQEPEARHALAEILWRSGDTREAQEVLATATITTQDAQLAMQLARMRRNQGQFDGAMRALQAAERAVWSDNVLLDALLFLKHCQREAAALDWCERELRRGRNDARLFATAGNLAMALGQFTLARERFQQALAQGIDLNVWYVPQALSNCQRYESIEHPDHALFLLLRDTPGMDARARASLDFALAKLKEESGDIAGAAVDYRGANAQLRATAPWPRDAWLQAIAERRHRTGVATPDLSASDFRPVFVVGLPRTGTTLVAERLGRHPAVRVRGEPPLIEYIARQLDALGPRADAAMLQEAAQMYVSQMRQDDAPATWYLDKNPLNFRHLDVIARLFPQARIVYCRRAVRDAAVSMWTQYFAQDDYGFANDFADIRAVHDSAADLMRHWQAVLPLPILTLDYERMVEATAEVDAELAQFLELPPQAQDEAAPPRTTAIGSASLWQARQPVYRHGLGRGERFAEFLPELRAAFP